MAMIHVFGPHGSGNRLNGRIIEASGFDPKVWVWSLPGRIQEAFDNNPRGDFYVVSQRNFEMTAQSMLKNGMVRTIEHAREWVQEAREQIEWFHEQLVREDDAKFIYIKYEHTIESGVDYTIRRLAHFFDIEPWGFEEKIVDGNLKYLLEDHSEDIGYGNAVARPATLGMKAAMPANEPETYMNLGSDDDSAA